MKFRYSDKKFERKLRKYSLTATYHREAVKDSSDGVLGTIRYVCSFSELDQSKPTLVMIHGTPGSSQAFFDYLKNENLRSQANVVLVDRLGHGYSDFGKPEISIDKQAESLLPIVKKYATDQGVVLAGHSYGGPIAAKISMLIPNNIDVLLMLAPAIDPENEKIFFVSHFPRVIPFKWISPKSFKVAADEKFAHEEQLRLMDKDWDKITAYTVHMHGMKDGIVSYKNLAYAEKKFKTKDFKAVSIPKKGHMFIWGQKKLVFDELNEIFKKLEGTTDSIP